MSEPPEIASAWLAWFSEALTSRNAKLASKLFLPNGWFRDVLIFDWDNRSLQGHAKIESYFSSALSGANIQNVVLDERAGLTPSYFVVTPDLSGVEAAFKFDTPIAYGRGYIRLLPDHSQPGEWRALAVYMTADNLKGHEEAGNETGVYDGHTLSWTDIKAERRGEVEADPQVVVVGAGQTGVQVAARFKQMGFRTIIIERNKRVGDNWRKRYPTLSLHTPRTHHNLLYAPFPSNWPTFTPRDKVAFWLEQYAEAQDLIVWTSTEILHAPTYDQTTGRWTMDLDKNGTKVTLHPAHIILATGTLGDPFVPQVEGTDKFIGDHLHAVQYAGGARYAGKRVAVIGAGNTSADICQDLCHHGADVTMVQRSDTCVVSAALVAKQLSEIWPEGVPTEISDFKTAAMPLGLLKQLLQAASEQSQAFDKQMHDDLRKSGLRLNYGPENSGQLFLVFQRGGGIDVGAAKLITTGKVKVRSGVEVQRFNEKSINFNDGSELEVDAVIFATGYYNIRPTVRKVFGAEMIDRTSQVWGLDEEGELKGCYRPSGLPGLWFAAGDFFNSRYMSKQLALLIRAIDLGYTNYPNLASIPPGMTSELPSGAEMNGV
ncbi:FAD/NAD-binding domain-containing protein [Rickenella mellea]|uniref:FAD/NAD-binding domain-containing protein n=1 Tax=Rickenella mellea TaxID=50990 RepID=A0A4Y7PQT2_9AGAM|nr:FAD/NAD-binding domain-containing protein [Rickenella mellea]